MLDASLTVTADAAVAFEFTVWNDGETPVEVTFRDAGKVDFAVFEDDDEVWRWSDGRMFAQVLQTSRIGPGEELVFEETWPDPSPGNYTAEAMLRAREANVSAKTSFSV